MRVGVTGATGFIGTHVVHSLTFAGHQLTTFPRGAAGLELGAPIEPDLFTGLEVVVHAAAYLPASYDDPAEARRCLELNGLGTLALLEAAHRAGVRRVILLSGNLYRSSSEPADEASPLDPSARAVFYLASKAYAETVAQWYRATARLEVVILRASSVYGAGLHRGMLATFTRRLLRGEPIVVQNGGTYRVDLVDVADVAHAVVATLGAVADGPLNIGAGVATSSRELAQVLVELTGASPRVVALEPETQPPAPFAPLSIARARTLIGFTPRSLRDGLTDYVAWTRTQLG